MAASPDGAASSAEWCRSFIEHFCIFRSPPGQPLLTSITNGRNAWQFYFPIATLDQQFAAHIAQLFWLRYSKRFAQRPFQLAGCTSGGVPLVCALQAEAKSRGVNVGAIESKKAAKSYGIRNWLEGVVDPRLPVIIVDDVVGGGDTFAAHARRLRELGLELAGGFCVASCKQAPPLTIANVEVQALFGPDDFVRSHEAYVAKYRRAPQFKGTVV